MTTTVALNMGRQVVLDLETTGMTEENRIIEVGCVELMARELSGRVLQHYVDPERDIEPKAQEVHGISREQLRGKPKFADVAQDLLDFVADAEVLIHNASFDVGFLDRELHMAGFGGGFDAYCSKITDTLEMARKMHPGGNGLDQLCDQYRIDRHHRDKHGALLDARLLAQVYLRMTGGQIGLELPSEAAVSHRIDLGAVEIPVLRPSEKEQRAHEDFMAQMDAANRGA